MRIGRKLLISVCAIGLLTAGTAVPAEGSSGVDKTSESSWEVVSQRPSTVTYFDPALGAWITSTGVETTSTLTPRDTSNSTVTAAAGCTKTEYLGNPARWQAATGPIYTQVTASVKVSSGCNNEYFYVNLREVYAFGYKPTVGTASNTAIKGGNTAYATVTYPCASGVSYFANSDNAPYTTAYKIIC